MRSSGWGSLSTRPPPAQPRGSCWTRTTGGAEGGHGWVWGRQPRRSPACPLGAQPGQPHGAWWDGYSPGLGEPHEAGTPSLAHGTGPAPAATPQSMLGPQLAPHPALQAGVWSSQAPSSGSLRTAAPSPRTSMARTVRPLCLAQPQHEPHAGKHRSLQPQPRRGARTRQCPVPWDLGSGSWEQGLRRDPRALGPEMAANSERGAGGSWAASAGPGWAGRTPRVSAGRRDTALLQRGLDSAPGAGAAQGQAAWGRGAGRGPAAGAALPCPRLALGGSEPTGARAGTDARPRAPRAAPAPVHGAVSPSPPAPLGNTPGPAAGSGPRGTGVNPPPAALRRTGAPRSLRRPAQARAGRRAAGLAAP